MSTKQNHKLILTDADGVILDWEKRFHVWMEERGFRVDWDLKTDYQLAPMYGMSNNRAKELIVEFNNSGAMVDIPAFRDSRSGVAMLVESGYQFICITSVSLNPVVKKLRLQNLENIFGKDVFVDLICLDTGADKDAALLPYKGSKLWWLEDKWENAVGGFNVGLRCIIVDHSHNRGLEHDGIFRCRNWKEIHALITECDMMTN